MLQTNFFEKKTPEIDLRRELFFAEMDPRLREKFFQFHKKNPLIYTYFEKFARQAMEAGRKRFSHWMIVNRIRWYVSVETSGKDFKISNDYIACYVRLLIYEHPEFEGFFKLKAMKQNRCMVRE